MKFYQVILLLLCVYSSISAEKNNLEFPDELSIGTSGSAYQTEGAWNVSDKGTSVWDWFTHEKNERILDKSNGDIACDSYHKYKEDVNIISDIGFQHYRFSISWTRILPTGFPNKISRDGIKFYEDLIDELRSKGIEPFVTLFHWDHPEIMNRMGSWTNELMVEYFADYARIVFKELGHKVKFWTTINEPNNYCNTSYAGSSQAPGMNLPFFANYLCVHNLLKAHARAYHIYDEEFRATQNGKIGIVIPCRHNFPKIENDTETPRIAFEFDCGWASHPIFSKNGDYPEIMKQRIGENSRLEGLPRSRLPEFSPYWINYIRGSSDYFGLNHYTSAMVEPLPRVNGKFWFGDSGILSTKNESWTTSPSDWLRVVPEGMRGVLNDIKRAYNNPPVHILENGVASEPGTNDFKRISFLHDYMEQMLLAVHEDNCNVKSYGVWSLLDNFEWDRGYGERFGIVEVDFNHPNRTRTPKLSARWLQEVIKKRKLIAFNETDLFNNF